MNGLSTPVRSRPCRVRCFTLSSIQVCSVGLIHTLLSHFIQAFVLSSCAPVETDTPAFGHTVSWSWRKIAPCVTCKRAFDCMWKLCNRGDVANIIHISFIFFCTFVEVAAARVVQRFDFFLLRPFKAEHSAEVVWLGTTELKEGINSNQSLS